ncbi:glutaredoxin [Mobilitalea sibirica]|uniref:Glutaredoxin n=1 Tax=Mobilitalea sibirica TaxID=1462919 RepID=A0A8J7KVD4_9FIRM|nr:glutaredoxin [Mobilitalea sibirica]MBH1940030.1 glutaredoxin [Mobilitalea sibirica]
MKIIMYGSEICPDCVEAKMQLSNRPDIELDYKNITEKTATLKEFLSFRDHEELFASIKEKGKIGIPFFILEDGTKTLDITDFVDIEIKKPDQSANSCSLDGKGNC